MHRSTVIIANSNGKPANLINLNLSHGLRHKNSLNNMNSPSKLLN